MTSVQLLVAGGLLVVAALYFVAVRAARRRAWSARVLIGLSVLSGVVLLAMVLTDWPGEQLNQFWADHSIFASVLSTVLLVSLGYLAFEARETAEQADLNRSVTSAGLSGLVDHLVDVDIALSMLASETAPEQMYAEGRPLRWIRSVREERQRKSTVSKAGLMLRSDFPTQSAPLEAMAWRTDLIDQTIRRIIGGMRDWAALIAVSEDGRAVLKRFGQVRLDLLELQDHIRKGRPDNARTDVAGLRTYVQLFALALERISSPDYLRPGIVAIPANGSTTPDRVGAPFEEMRRRSPLYIREAMRLLDAQHELSAKVRDQGLPAT